MLSNSAIFFSVEHVFLSDTYYFFPVIFCHLALMSDVIGRSSGRVWANGCMTTIAESLRCWKISLTPSNFCVLCLPLLLDTVYMTWNAKAGILVTWPNHVLLWFFNEFYDSHSPDLFFPMSLHMISLKDVVILLCISMTFKKSWCSRMLFSRPPYQFQFKVIKT